MKPAQARMPPIRTEIRHPQTPPRSGHAQIAPPESPGPVSPATLATPKAVNDINSVMSLQSFQSFGSTHSSQNGGQELSDPGGFDYMLGGASDTFYYDFDAMQTPDFDPLSPTFYDMHSQVSPQHHTLLTPELSGSVGSGTSLSASSIIGPPLPAAPQSGSQANLHVEGLGIAEPAWPLVPSPESAARRAKQGTVPMNAPRVTKKASKQTLKPRRSRANLDAAATAASSAGGGSSQGATSANASAAEIRAVSPSGSVSTGSSISSALSPTSGVPAQASSHRPRQPQSFSSQSDAHYEPKEHQLQHHMQPQGPIDMQRITSQPHEGAPHPAKLTQKLAQMAPPMASHGARAGAASAVNAGGGAPPRTPFAVPAARLRGKAAASPAMRSPMRPGAAAAAASSLGNQRPRLPAAAAATALFMPSAPPADQTRQNAMAAAAAAAAASASGQSPATPIGHKDTPRVSPSTIIASAKTQQGSFLGQGGSHDMRADGAAGNSASAGAGAISSPTPAARMHSNSKLVSAASDSSPAKGMWQQAHSQPMPLSQLPRPIASPRKSASSSNMRRDGRRKPQKVIPEMSSALNQFQVELNPRPATTAPRSASLGSSVRSRSVGSPPLHYNGRSTPFYDAQQQWYTQGPHSMPPAMPQPQLGSAGAPPQTMGAMPQYMPSNAPQMMMPPPSHGMPPMPPVPPSMHGMAPPANPGGAQHGMPPQMPPMPPMPQMGPVQTPPSRGPAAPMQRPQTTVPTSYMPERVQPEGEPLQHVWATRPQPERTLRKFNKTTPSRSASKQHLKQPRPSAPDLRQPSLKPVSKPQQGTPQGQAEQLKGIKHEQPQQLQQPPQQLRSQPQHGRAGLPDQHAAQRSPLDLQPNTHTDVKPGLGDQSEANPQGVFRPAPIAVSGDISQVAEAGSASGELAGYSANSVGAVDLEISNNYELDTFAIPSDFGLSEEWANDLEFNEQWDLMDALDTPI